MPEQIQETSETSVENNGAVSRNQVARQSEVASPGSKIEQVVYLLLGILEAILALRVVLSLLGANVSNAFAHLIYSASGPFASPFYGLFGYKFQSGISRLDIETLVAMAVYGLVGWGIVQLTRIGRK